jgi:hypothetical protein
MEAAQPTTYNNYAAPKSENDLMQYIIAEVNQLKNKMRNVLYNWQPNPQRKGEYIRLPGQKPLLNEDGINYVMSQLENTLDPNTLLSNLTIDEIFNIIMVEMTSLAQALIGNPEWGIGNIDALNKVFLNYFKCTYYIMKRCAKDNNTFDKLMDRFSFKFFKNTNTYTPDYSHGGR